MFQNPECKVLQAAYYTQIFQLNEVIGNQNLSCGRIVSISALTAATLGLLLATPPYAALSRYTTPVIMQVNALCARQINAASLDRLEYLLHLHCKYLCQEAKLAECSSNKKLAKEAVNRYRHRYRPRILAISINPWNIFCRTGAPIRQGGPQRRSRLTVDSSFRACNPAGPV